MLCLLCYITCYVYVMLYKHVMLCKCYITCYVCYVMLYNMLCLCCYINMLSYVNVI